MGRAIRSKRGSSQPETRKQLYNYIPYLLNRLSNRWNLDQNRDLGEHGINNVVFRTLSVLYIYKTLTVNEIAVLAVTEQSNASRTVDSMALSGLVNREIAEDDLRRRVVGLTAAGERLLKTAWPTIDRNYDRLVNGIDQHDLKLCARVLGMMLDNIRQNEI
jgi:DNA-binding MarR family transcriptional regulator